MPRAQPGFAFSQYTRCLLDCMNKIVLGQGKSGGAFGFGSLLLLNLRLIILLFLSCLSILGDLGADWSL